MGKVNKWVAGLVLAGVGAAVPAQAQTHCWAKQETAAAQVRELQTMLMVAALRCRAAHIDIAADYDGFVIAQKDAIAAANSAIKQHFGSGDDGQAEYDRFATSLANAFGDDATTEATCAAAAALAHDGSAATAANLGEVAARVQPAALPSGACDVPAAAVTLAAAVPARSEPLPPILLLAPPPPPAPAPVVLPADVNAALLVLARYSTPQPAPSAPTQTALAAVH